MSETMLLNPELAKVFESKVLDFAKQFTDAVEQVNQAQGQIQKLQAQKTNLEQDIEKYRQAIEDADNKNVESIADSTEEKRIAYVKERKQASEMVTEIKRMIPAIDGQIKEAQDRLRLAQVNLESKISAIDDGPQSEVALMVCQKIIEAVKLFETWKQVARRVCLEKGLPLITRFIEPSFAFAMRKLPEMPDGAMLLEEEAADISKRFIEGLRMCRTFLTHNR